MVAIDTMLWAQENPRGVLTCVQDPHLHAIQRETVDCPGQLITLWSYNMIHGWEPGNHELPGALQRLTDVQPNLAQKEQVMLN